MTAWFTSDTHYGHVNVIKYTNRPFGSVKEMNAELMARHNALIKPDDIVYFLGDFGFGNVRVLTEIFEALNGRFYFVRGNHDHEFLRYWAKNKPVGEDHKMVCIKDYYEIRENKQVKACLFHFPLAVWYHNYYGTYMLHGHSHGRYTGVGKILDVGVDCHNYKPISFEEIKQILL